MNYNVLVLVGVNQLLVYSDSEIYYVPYGRAKLDNGILTISKCYKKINIASRSYLQKYGNLCINKKIYIMGGRFEIIKKIPKWAKK